MAEEEGIHNEISGTVAGNAVQVGAVYGDVALFPQPSAQLSMDELQALLARQLASKVRTLSAQEEEHRRVHDPRPLPVRWRTAAEELFDHWDNIHGAASHSEPMSLTGGFMGIRDTYEAVPSGRLMILGRAGAGKTVLAHRLVLAVLEDDTYTGPVPVLFSLSTWNPASTGLREWMVHQLVRDFPFLERRDRAGNRGADGLVADGWILPVLDGFDEIPDRFHRDAVAEMSRVRGPLVVTSRLDEYTKAARAVKALGGAAAIELDDLTLDEAERYLQASTTKTRTAEWGTVFHHLRTAPEETASQNLTPVLTTPLTVMLARTTYNDTPDHNPDELLDVDRFPTREDLEEHLLRVYVDALYDPRRNISTGTAVRPNWNPDRALHWLGYLATHLTKLDTHDLAWWQLPNTLRRYTRVLVTMTAVGLTFGLVLGLLVGPRAGLERGLESGLEFALTVSLGLVLAPALINEVGLSRGRTGREPERLVLRVRRRRAVQRTWLTSLKRSVPEFTKGLLYGYGILFVFYPASGGEISVDYVLFGLGIGFLFGYINVGMSDLGESADPRNVINPWQLLVTDRTVTLVRTIMASLVFGVVFGLLPGLFAELEFGLVAGFLAGLKSGLSIGLGYGLVIWTIRLVLSAWGSWLLFARLWLPLTGRLPWRLKRFLDDAYHRGALRKTGAVYQFRHALLRDHLARHY